MKEGMAMAATKAKKSKTTSDWRELELEDLRAEIVKARDEEELSWAEVKERSGGMALGKLMFQYDCATVDEKDRIKYRTEEDLPAKFQEARENNLSWGLIAARVGLPPSKVRSIYEAEFGEGSSKLEGGMTRVAGRRGVVAERPEPKPKANGTTAAKPKATTKKAAAKAKAKTDDSEDSDSAGKDLSEMTLEELQERLDGRTITVHSDTTGKNTRVKVKTVKETDGLEIELVAGNGATRTFAIDKIVKASK